MNEAKTLPLCSLHESRNPSLKSQLTTVVCPIEVPPPGVVTVFLLSSGRKVLEEKENRPSCVQTRPCFTRNTSRMSPLALAKSGNWKMGRGGQKSHPEPCR